ncbi:unnamed protein product [Phaedon cochleariae]|uniref:Uncharacterized protein n=1 Tax=Phaedon cochleariae TaxID=80249 RepID=A0A9N9SA52_PHACE|nr:unnamed protein product [Phaedon cochleariae]
MITINFLIFCNTRYYSPGYPETLLDKVEQYSPQMMTVLRETNVNDNEMQTEILNIMEDQASSGEENEEEKSVPIQ